MQPERPVFESTFDKTGIGLNELRIALFLLAIGIRHAGRGRTPTAGVFFPFRKEFSSTPSNSESMDRIFYGNLPRIRKESQIGPQASAEICSS
jgi:hypothetical protein